MPESSQPLACEVTDSALLKALQIAELFRELDSEVPGQLVSTFLFVASHNPCHMQAIEEGLKISPNSASRNTDWLSNRHRIKTKEGLGLVVKTFDPANGRRKLVELTPAGEKMAADIVEILSSK